MSRARNFFLGRLCLLHQLELLIFDFKDVRFAGVNLVRQRPMFIQGFLLTRPLPQQEVVPACAMLKARAQELLLTSRETALTAIVRLETDHGSADHWPAVPQRAS